MRRKRGRAAGLPCADCGGPAHEWAYDHSDPDEAREVLGHGREVRFSFDLDRYRPMCRPCHTALDARESVKRTPCMGPGCGARVFAPLDYCQRHTPGPASPFSKGKDAGRGLPLGARFGTDEAGRAWEFKGKPAERSAPIESEGSKACRGCDEVKPLVAFPIDRARKSGRSGLCLECQREKARERYRLRTGASA